MAILYRVMKDSVYLKFGNQRDLYDSCHFAFLGSSNVAIVRIE